MSTTSFGSSVLQTSADQRSPLGAIRETDDHESRWVYCQNTTGGTLPAKRLVSSQQNASNDRALAGAAGASALRSTLLGVTTLEVPAGHYFWARCGGTTTITSTGAVTAGQAALCAALGKVASSASPGAFLAIGHIVVGTAGADEDAVVWLDL